MLRMKRRDFLRTSSLTGAGVIAANRAWALNRLEPLEDTLGEEYPYRDWEDLYRREFTWDKIGKSAHCINCVGNCAFNVYVKDGIVLREEQLAAYPQIAPDVPDPNPRGCQKGSIHSAAMYEGDRLRYPLKRVGERGEGKWQRMSWEEITTEIADKIIDIYETYGPGKLMTHTGSGNLSMVRFAAPYRFASLVGGVQLDIFTDVGDLNTGAHLAYGNPLESFTSDAWFDADYIMMSLFNPNATRIPDAHYIWEAKWNGARVVSVAPDYNPSSIHADLWISVKPGTDPFLAMSFVNVIIAEELYKPGFMKEQTDLPVLVRADTGRLLREADIVDGGSDQVFYHWDLVSGAAVPIKGSMGSDEKTIALAGVDPALEGTFEVGGLPVTTVFEKVKTEAARYSPEDTADVTGVAPETVRQEARAFARARKAILMHGFNIGRYSNGIYTGWAQALMLGLTGHGGKAGGIDTSWIDWNHPKWLELALFGFRKLPRLEPGGMGEFVRGHMIDHARAHYDPAKLKERVGFDLDELQEMIDESVGQGWMPYHGEMKGLISIADNKFRRNKFADKYRARILEEVSELFVDINVRMDSTAQWADYLLPAASHYEAWDLRTVGYHRFMNVFSKPVDPIGEARPDWDIMVLLTQKIQERAIARSITSYEDGAVTRDFHTIHDDYTMGGMLMTDYDATKWLVDNSPEIGGVSLEEGAERGFFVMTAEAGANQPLPPDEPYNPFVAQTEGKKPYDTLTGRITFFCDHPTFVRLGATVPTARLNAGPEASSYPLSFYSPHTRWGIHSNWRSNKFMMRLQRGEPNIYINPRLAARKGIADGSKVRIFNGAGEFFAQAKFYPSLPETSIMMEHGWEPHQYDQWKPMNNAMATLIQPLELAGGWGHLGFKLFKWNANQLAHESGVDVEPV
ncbi:dimethylsulfide dehydrogenase subunit alpha/complex iron-sulfur molybdoenzyme family reductase subunit alpha [Rhodovulum imhoffii]|uniref:Dimethylsulfide dehydrogenase subunit alpha/complex iron-sulfur molybdoenzyme family reductase subunit alpha n=1 Tax=Rhodovulum imhoffii TaxID=365340 RepID=A0A2T5BPK3_9RHOB|nr:molybdopterin-dependent oxidoreductase [Rhodovulum imhoffii]MBK5932865.1 dimethylsulfide dehydrogenase [Rhodovulum imhoffii]PTN00978.1 dimethylsulfide dehydrogenase subunit alpha/complex iron-sulfur molybdoenzyme family reductase subunit alpha [Rhodovulum imhoffii]